MRKISLFGSTMKKDLETVFIWRYLVIYQQYYLPLPPYIFLQNQAMVFTIPELCGRTISSWLSLKKVGPCFWWKLKLSPFIRLPTFPWQIWLKITSQFLLVSVLAVHIVSFYLPFENLYSQGIHWQHLDIRPLNGPVIPGKVLPIQHCLHVLYLWRLPNALIWFFCTILWSLSNYSSNEDPAG